MTKQPGGSSRWNKTLYGKRWYVLTIVAITSLLVCLIILHPRGSQSVVESVIKYDTSRERLSDADQAQPFEDRMASRIRSEVAIRAVVQEMDRNSVLAMGPLATDAELLKQRLHVRTRPLDNAHEIRIRFLADDEVVGVDLVDRVARHFIDTQRTNSDQWLSAEHVVQDWERRVADLDHQLGNVVENELLARRQQFDTDLAEKREERTRRREAAQRRQQQQQQQSAERQQQRAEQQRRQQIAEQQRLQQLSRATGPGARQTTACPKTAAVGRAG